MTLFIVFLLPGEYALSPFTPSKTIPVFSEIIPKISAGIKDFLNPPPSAARNHAKNGHIGYYYPCFGGLGVFLRRLREEKNGGSTRMEAQSNSALRLRGCV
jgi:hypothetical protein